MKNKIAVGIAVVAALVGYANAEPLHPFNVAQFRYGCEKETQNDPLYRGIITNERISAYCNCMANAVNNVMTVEEWGHTLNRLSIDDSLHQKLTTIGIECSQHELFRDILPGR